ncbi:MAG: helix-turn-helix transcriptional regulator, partial [Thermodesulfobacteriota bacterium]
VNPSVINEICNEKRNISPEMYLKLGKYFEEAGLNANFWSRVQSKYNIDEALKNVNLNDIKPIKLDFEENNLPAN